MELPRLDYLKAVAACIRFVSAEPLLEDLGVVDLTGIHWVIVGGESGPKSRPMKREWALNIKNQCDAKKVAFFFKQWGGWGADGKKRHKKQNGRLLDGRTYDAVPELPPHPLFVLSEDAKGEEKTWHMAFKNTNRIFTMAVSQEFPDRGRSTNLRCFVTLCERRI